MRIGLRLAALVVGGALAAHSVLLAPDAAIVRVLALAGFALAGVAASFHPGWPSWAGAAALGTAYAVALGAGHPDLEPAAPVVAVGLYLLVELLDVAGAEPSSPGVRSVRSLHAAAVACVSAAVGAGLLVVGAGSATTGTAAVVATAGCGCVLLLALASTVRDAS
ncbi:MAG: hypothetical protein M3271_10025 [Actinomycetota bacterium]|nr:hypothetical protein [Actinomycetota bacterium]